MNVLTTRGQCCVNVDMHYSSVTGVSVSSPAAAAAVAGADGGLQLRGWI